MIGYNRTHNLTTLLPREAITGSVTKVHGGTSMKKSISLPTKRILAAKEKAETLTHLTTKEFRKEMGIGRIVAASIFGKIRHAIGGLRFSDRCALVGVERN